MLMEDMIVVPLTGPMAPSLPEEEKKQRAERIRQVWQERVARMPDYAPTIMRMLPRWEEYFPGPALWSDDPITSQWRVIDEAQHYRVDLEEIARNDYLGERYMNAALEQALEIAVEENPDGHPPIRIPEEIEEYLDEDQAEAYLSGDLDEEEEAELEDEAMDRLQTSEEAAQVKCMEALVQARLLRTAFDRLLDITTFEAPEDWTRLRQMIDSGKVAPQIFDWVDEGTVPLPRLGLSYQELKAQIQETADPLQRFALLEGPTPLNMLLMMFAAWWVEEITLMIRKPGEQEVIEVDSMWVLQAWEQELTPLEDAFGVRPLRQADGTFKEDWYWKNPPLPQAPWWKADRMEDPQVRDMVCPAWYREWMEQEYQIPASQWPWPKRPAAQHNPIFMK